MANISLMEIMAKLANQADDYGQQEGQALRRLMEACSASDFLGQVRTEADVLFRNEPLMHFMAGLLTEGFDAKRLADFDLFINPRSVPNIGSGDLYVLFPDQTERFINHPGEAVGHYYGEGRVCGSKGEVWLHGGMQADMNGSATLRLFGHSQALCDGQATAELFDVSLAYPKGQATVVAHDRALVHALTEYSACLITADGQSCLMVDAGKHLLNLSGDVLFIDQTASVATVSGRCSGYKPKGAMMDLKKAEGLIWRKSNDLVKNAFSSKIRMRRAVAMDGRKPLYAPDRLDQAKRHLLRVGEAALLSGHELASLEHCDSMDKLASCLFVYLEDLLRYGLDMGEMKRLFREDELRQANIYTGSNPVPSDLQGKYHVFDDLIVSQTSDKAEGCFHDRSIGVVKAGLGNCDGQALCQGIGESRLNAAGSSTLLLCDQANGMATDEVIGYATDRAQINASGFSLIDADSDAFVEAKGNSLTRLHDVAIGRFNGKAMFVADDLSYYTQLGYSNGVAVVDEYGLSPMELDCPAVPKVSAEEARLFYAKCMQERSEAMAANRQQVVSTSRQRSR